MIKVIRSYPAPPSLAIEKSKRSGSYREKDVIDQLTKDFHNKCYLCNMGNLADIQVEHLNPHHGGRDIELKFDWDNLFLSCCHCNGVKNQEKYDMQILDCCAEDPEYFLDFYCVDDSVNVQTKVSDNAKVERTAELLTEVFNLRNTGIRCHTCEMRVKALQKEMGTLYVNLQAYKTKPDAKLTLRKLKGLLKRNSAFSAFKRSYVRHNIEQYRDLELFLD